MSDISTHDRQDKHNPQDDFDQWLTEQLHSRQPYLEDEGFSDQVMATVPVAPRRRLFRAVTWAILLALTAAIIVLTLFPGWTALYSLISAFVSLPLLTLLQIGLGIGLAITALGALAIWQELKGTG